MVPQNKANLGIDQNTNATSSGTIASGITGGATSGALMAAWWWHGGGIVVA